MKTKIHIYGCDDTTTVELDLTPAELETIKRLVKVCNKNSTYGCMPSMEIEQPGNKEEKGEKEK